MQCLLCAACVTEYAHDCTSSSMISGSEIFFAANSALTGAVYRLSDPAGRHRCCPAGETCPPGPATPLGLLQVTDSRPTAAAARDRRLCNSSHLPTPDSTQSCNPTSPFGPTRDSQLQTERISPTYHQLTVATAWLVQKRTHTSNYTRHRDEPWATRQETTHGLSY